MSGVSSCRRTPITSRYDGSGVAAISVAKSKCYRGSVQGRRSSWMARFCSRHRRKRAKPITMSIEGAMISRLIRHSFHAPLVTALLVAAGTTIGAFWLQDLRRDVFPDLSAPIFNVITQNPAMGAEEL